VLIDRPQGLCVCDIQHAVRLQGIHQTLVHSGEESVNCCGQGICLKDNSDCPVNITITDGGADLGNPLPAAAGPETETTPPVESGDWPTGRDRPAPANMQRKTGRPLLKQ